MNTDNVAVLIIVQPREAPNERYTFLQTQPRNNTIRIPIGPLHALNAELGRLGFEVRKEELVDMSTLARAKLHPKDYTEPTLNIPFLLWDKQLDRKEIEYLRGVFENLEKPRSEYDVNLCMQDFDNFESLRDRDTLEAFHLFSALHRRGWIYWELERIQESRNRR
jgi:ADP-sugar diphosphatase